MDITDRIKQAIAAHARPLPEYVSPGDLDLRFGVGNAPDGWHLTDESLVRAGHYCTYARRATAIVLVPGFPSIPTYWRPAVFFLPDDVIQKPEMAYDGDPLRRGCKLVPVVQGADMKEANIQRDVFGHVDPALDALARFYRRTGQRWEVLYLRERDRSQKAGEAFDWSELPVDPGTLS
ncbi:hypothetical protein [Mesorhizobium sp. B2-4-6]|uniref:hypothetical protein n=1 Tax=Mesorhizobium sp. B2-4-6 TaxID=2589943 RepID=UPI00112D5B56|nr:hypothetical protein [Mesorhizobium sp. B2-4-6]TPL51524.1 hypothetical protein FJ957_08010 [Mesorhizobium sp. B2-4-6]